MRRTHLLPLLLAACQAESASMSTPRPRLAPLRLRGGRKQDHSGDAADLFDNMRIPAALVAGAIVPLASFAGTRYDATDTPVLVLLKQLHYFLSAWVLSCALMSCVYATVAVNSLTEATHEPVENVRELLSRDYELEWLGCNVCFFAALFGLGATVGLSGYIYLGPPTLVPVTCMLASMLFLMLSVIKRGVERTGLYAGWGVERALGPSFTMLAARYVRLMVVSGLRSVHMLPSLVLTLCSMVLIVRLVMELVSSA